MYEQACSTVCEQRFHLLFKLSPSRPSICIFSTYGQLCIFFVANYMEVVKLKCVYFHQGQDFDVLWSHAHTQSDSKHTNILAIHCYLHVLCANTLTSFEYELILLIGAILINLYIKVENI